MAVKTAWVLTEQLISRLDIIDELAKRILKLPKWASNTAANVVMDWTRVRAKVAVVVQKLSFLHRLVSAIGWEVLWDAAVSRGGRSIRRLQLLVKVLCRL